MQSFFEWLESWPVSVGLRESSWMFPACESVHVIAISLVVGSVMIVDLRVLGLASRSERVTELSQAVLPWTWGAFAVALISGFCMFASKADAYFGNTSFQIKMLLMAAAFVNMLTFHFIPYRSVRFWDEGTSAPPLARLACGVSLTLWVFIVLMGRWIGFSIEG